MLVGLRRSLASHMTSNVSFVPPLVAIVDGM
jgi:hypothetical protein